MATVVTRRGNCLGRVIGLEPANESKRLIRRAARVHALWPLSVGRVQTDGPADAATG